MQEADKLKLYNLVISIKELSVKIEALKRDRELLLDEFKSIQSGDESIKDNNLS